MPDAKRNWELREIFGIAVLVFIPSVLLDQYVRPGIGLPAGLAALMILIAVLWRWDLSEQPWFWRIVAAIVTVHLPLIRFIPWTTKWIPAAISTPFCFVDILLILRIFGLGERFFNRREESPR